MPFDFEFHLNVAGQERLYRSHAHSSADGRVDKISLWHVLPNESVGQHIDISIDPSAFRQVAMPGKEVLSRIAITQAIDEHLVGDKDFGEGVFLDFTFEPWEGRTLVEH